MSQKRINLSELGKMLNASFSSSELSSMAFDIDAGFLHEEISHLAKSKKVIEIIKYCALRGELGKILEFTKVNNPLRYHEFLPVLYEDGDTNELIKGLSPVSDEDSNDVIEILAEMAKLMREMQVQGRSQHIIVNGDGNVIGDGNQNQQIKFGDHANISGTFNAALADNIRDSFNTVEQSNGPEEIKVLLQTFLKSVEDVAKEAPTESKDDIEALVKHGGRFADDALAKRPDEEEMRFSLKRLTKAADNIGKLAVPVIFAAKSVIRAVGYQV